MLKNITKKKTMKLKELSLLKINPCHHNIFDDRDGKAPLAIIISVEGRFVQIRLRKFYGIKREL